MFQVKENVAYIIDKSKKYVFFFFFSIIVMYLYFKFLIF